MPWKGEKDPYKIWISEIILQQTRVQQGLEYYNRFITAWPDVNSLAAAKEQEVYKLWEGLGYYSRCRNLITSAKFISNDLHGKFPETYDGILALKGIGNYTAAAIASFAFNLPYAVVDGNVFRVLSRFFGIETPIDSTEGKKAFSRLAAELIDRENPGEYNQAIMDFGAVVCKPVQPLCPECLFQSECEAYRQDQVAMLPRKEKSIKQRQRFFNYLVIQHGDSIYVNQRREKDIWQNLYEFILLETEHLASEDEFLRSPALLSLLDKNHFSVDRISNISKQKLTHQIITGRFFHLSLKKPAPALKKYKAVPVKDLLSLPFPKFITSYLQD